MALEIAHGSYTGDGNDNRSITGLGFLPKVVFISADSSSVGASGIMSFDSMPSDSSTFVGDNTSLLSNYIQAFESDGFEIGSNARVNNSGTTFYYFALGGSDVDTGSYTGNGSDDRAITGIGFQPEFVMLKGANNDVADFKMTADGAAVDTTQLFGASSNGTNRIQSLDSDGFTVGTDAEVNTNTTLYYYAAVNAITGQTKSVSYTGDGVDDRDITGVGFSPEVLIINKNGTSNAGFRTPSHSSGESSPFQQTTVQTNDIQGFGVDGFTIGTNARVNTNSSTYYYIAMTSVVPTVSSFVPTMQIV